MCRVGLTSTRQKKRIGCSATKKVPSRAPLDGSPRPRALVGQASRSASPTGRLAPRAAIVINRVKRIPRGPVVKDPQIVSLNYGETRGFFRVYWVIACVIAIARRGSKVYPKPRTE